MFIERHGDAVAAAAECDAHGQFALLDGACEGMGRIGIIETFGTRSSEIIHFVSFAFEVSDEEFLHLVSGMVGCYAYLLCFHNMRIYTA